MAKNYKTVTSIGTVPLTGYKANGTNTEMKPDKMYTERQAQLAESVSSAASELAARRSALNNPGKYSEQYAAAINDYINRGKFEYDAAKDPLYQQYKDSYTRSGQLAMRDTAAQAAALTGGYGNSYAQSAGQQAYNAYMQQLNDKIPELWQLAYGKYNQEGQDMLSRIGVLGDADDKDYGRRTDAWNRALSEYSMYNELYGDERNFGYTAEQDAIAADLAERRFRYEQEQNAAALEYQKQRDAVSDAQWERNYALSLAAKGGSSGGTGDVNLFTYAGTDTKNDDYNIYYDSNGKQYSVARGVNPYTGTKNADAKNGTFSNGYQPNNVGGSRLTKTGLTDVVNGRTQNVWVDEDGRAWIWDGTQNSYQKYMVNGSWMKGTKLNNLLKRQS